MSKLKGILLWIVTVVLAMIFLMVGSTKLFEPARIVEQFAGWGYPAWFVTVIGAFEVLGALLLLVPWSARFGACILVLVMLGAAFTHVRAGEWPNPLFNLLFAAGLFWIGRSRMPRRSAPAGPPGRGQDSAAPPVTPGAGDA